MRLHMRWMLAGAALSSVGWIALLMLYWKLDSGAPITPSASDLLGSHGVHLPSRGSLLGRAGELAMPSGNRTPAVLPQLQGGPGGGGDPGPDYAQLAMVRTAAEKQSRADGYQQHAFNTLVSQRIGLRRHLPDTRNALCANQSHPDSLPDVTVIVCYYNEDLSTLLRTVQSVLDRTPARLLREVLLVDDASTSDVTDKLEAHIGSNQLTKVRVLRAQQRLGLMRARNFGVTKAKGEVLVFLDSHVEVNVAWLPPLLAPIAADRRVVTVPIIDIINADTFAYSASPLVRGGFNWGMFFQWEPVPRERFREPADYVRPIDTPTMAGGLFAMERAYFLELGQYDPGMDVWGGENLEMSFRVWTCGGRLQIIPCSRIGHVFRKRRPYSTPEGMRSTLENSLRVAHVWLDDYKDYFLETRPEARRTSYGDVSDRIALRKRLDCKSFKWYLETVYPELPLPPLKGASDGFLVPEVPKRAMQPWYDRKREYTGAFRLSLKNSNLCVQAVKGFKTRGSRLALYKCSNADDQVFHETSQQELVLQRLYCLDAGGKAPALQKCTEMGGDQQWNYNSETGGVLYNMAAGMCLAVAERRESAPVTMEMCRDDELVVWDLLAKVSR